MNIDNLYSTRIQKTFDEDQTEIVSILKANPKSTIKLINYHKGLPLSYSATMVAVERGAVDLNVKAEQAVIIELARSTFIRSPLFKHDVFAQAQYVNIKKMAASFVKFTYVEIMAERRNFIRLELEPTPAVVIESPQGKYEGVLSDLSLSGISVMSNTSVPLERDSEVTACFTLAGSEQSADSKVRVAATLVSIKDDVRPYKYVFSIHPDKASERVLSHYIFRRQIEIIREIKDAAC